MKITRSGLVRSSSVPLCMFATCLVRRRTKVVGNTALAIDRWQPNKRLRARSGSPLVDLANDFLVAGAIAPAPAYGDDFSRSQTHNFIQILMLFVRQSSGTMWLNNENMDLHPQWLLWW